MDVRSKSLDISRTFRSTGGSARADSPVLKHTPHFRMLHISRELVPRIARVRTFKLGW